MAAGDDDASGNMKLYLTFLEKRGFSPPPWRSQLKESWACMLNNTVLAVLPYVHEGFIADVAFLQV